MKVYRIVKTKARSRDLSGTGAYVNGGRWNNPGTYVLYTSTSISLGFIEILVHADESELPPNLFTITIEIDDAAPIYSFPDSELPKDWREPEDLKLKKLGNQFFSEQKYLGIKVRSAVLPDEWNILLNPQFPGFNNLVKIISIDPFDIDKRFLK